MPFPIYPGGFLRGKGGGFPTDQLWAYYNFDNNWNDQSGNGHHIVNTGGGFVNDRFGNSNSAGDWGFSDYGRTTDTFSSSDWTVAAWVNPDAMNLHYWFCIGELGTATYDEVIMAADSDGDARVQAYNGTSLQTRTSNNDDVFTIGSWRHVIIAFDQTTNTLDMYKNNVQVSGYPASFTINDPSAGRLLFTQVIAGSTSSAFDGQIDDFFIYSKVLDSTERAAVFNYPQAFP